MKPTDDYVSIPLLYVSPLTYKRMLELGLDTSLVREAVILPYVDFLEVEEHDLNQ